jgi:hypothetical protein
MRLRACGLKRPGTNDIVNGSAAPKGAVLDFIHEGRARIAAASHGVRECLAS